jgi:hypothetical protein
MEAVVAVKRAVVVIVSVVEMGPKPLAMEPAERAPVPVMAA